MGLQTREEGGGCPPGSSSECCVCSFCFSPGNTAVCGSSVSAPPPKAGQAVPRPGCRPRERRAGAPSPPVTVLPGEARGRRRPRASHRGPRPRVWAKRASPMAVHPGPESRGVMGARLSRPRPVPQPHLPRKASCLSVPGRGGKLCCSVYRPGASAPWPRSAGRLGISFLNGLLAV